MARCSPSRRWKKRASALSKCGRTWSIAASGTARPWSREFPPYSTRCWRKTIDIVHLLNFYLMQQDRCNQTDKKDEGGRIVGALDGLKIADFSWVGAGPRATKDLADNGATVIKIESRKRLDLGRMSPP